MLTRTHAWCLSLLLAMLAGCHTLPPPAPTGGWEARRQQLQGLAAWQLDGRAAVALGAQGWQANLDWRQDGAYAELHLAGPLGIGAQVIRQTPSGFSVNGAAPSSAAVAQLQQQLGFDLPVAQLRFWLLGIPDPGAPFELSRNEQDRAQHIDQAGWSIDYERYLTVASDVLPGRVILNRDAVRVRIVIDHWEVP